MAEKEVVKPKRRYGKRVSIVLVLLLVLAIAYSSYASRSKEHVILDYVSGTVEPDKPMLKGFRVDETSKLDMAILIDNSQAKIMWMILNQSEDITRQDLAKKEGWSGGGSLVVWNRQGTESYVSGILDKKLPPGDYSFIWYQTDEKVGKQPFTWYLKLVEDYRTSYYKEGK